MIADVITENPKIHAAFGRQPKCLPGQPLFNFEHRCDNCLLLNLFIYNVYVSRIGQISGHMTDNCDVSFDNPKNSLCEVNNSIVTLDNPNFFR